jgi:nucleoside 2-deoxyribosyltransferase
MKKIYIAGPDVFESDALQRGEKYIALCAKYGFIGLYPLDNIVDFSQPKQKIAQDIFLANRAMIQEADIVIANLNAFRGKEADSGTVWECGYAYGLGKEVYGYMQNRQDYCDSFDADEKCIKEDVIVDDKGRVIEDFEHPINLMIACSVEKILQGDLQTVLEYLKK